MRHLPSPQDWEQQLVAYIKRSYLNVVDAAFPLLGKMVALVSIAVSPSSS